MRIEQLEQYVYEARANKTPDEQIRQELMVGGWAVALIDKALATGVQNHEEKLRKVDEQFTVPQPVFFSSFLTTFIILLVIFNLITYWGEITGAPNSPPVTNMELIGGIVLCFVIAAILAGMYAGIRKLMRGSKKTELTDESHSRIFLTSSVTLLAVYIVFIYWGQIIGSPTAIPVTSVDIVGGVILSLVMAGVISLIFKAVRKIRGK